MDKYKKYPCPIKAKPEDKLMYMFASLERENQKLKSINTDLLEACKIILGFHKSSVLLDKKYDGNEKNAVLKLEQAIAKTEAKE